MYRCTFLKLCIVMWIFYLRKKIFAIFDSILSFLCNFYSDLYINFETFPSPIKIHKNLLRPSGTSERSVETFIYAPGTFSRNLR